MNKVKARCELHGIKFSPPTLKSDGTRKSRPSAMLQITSVGSSSDGLAKFITSEDSVVNVTIAPLADAAEVRDFKGVARIAKVEIVPPEPNPEFAEPMDPTPIYKLSLVFEHESAQPLASLIMMRLEMCETNSSTAMLSISPFQGRLPFGKPALETEADRAVASWSGAIPASAESPAAEAGGGARTRSRKLKLVGEDAPEVPATAAKPKRTRSSKGATEEKPKRVRKKPESKSKPKGESKPRSRSKKAKTATEQSAPAT